MIKTILFKHCPVFILLILYPLSASSLLLQEQTFNNHAIQMPRVYLDCGRCDTDYIRKEITFINYVRIPELADIHLFITNESAGVGGREYELTFIDQTQSEGIDYTLTFYVDRNATSDEIRRELVRVIKMGLAPFMAQTPRGSRFSLSYEAPAGDGSDDHKPSHDPWDYWVFRIYAGSISLGLETNQADFDSRWGFFADKVTEEWKIRLRPYFNYEFVEIKRVEYEDPIVSSQHRHGFDSYLIKSLDAHWSAGVFADYITRNDRNLKHRFRFNLGLEYSLLPYDLATRKAITFTYQIGYSPVNYYEETIFNKTKEHLFNHQLEAGVHFQQPWGDIYGGVNGSHYFHDMSLRRAEIFGNVSVRLLKGLSLVLSTNFEMIQDQLSLPIGDASLEEVLLRQRELSTDFSLNGSIALTYSFGSDFANVVNTRF